MLDQPFETFLQPQYIASVRKGVIHQIVKNWISVFFPELICSIEKVLSIICKL